MEKSFRAALKEEFAKRQTRNSKYSLRSFARQLGVSPSALSEAMNGKRNLSAKMIERLSKRLLWNQAIIRGFENNLHKNVSLETFELIGEWCHFAVLSLAKTKSYKPKVDFIAQRLGISKKKAKAAVDRLVGLEFLTGGLTLKDNSEFFTDNDIPSVAIKKNHVEGMELAQEALFDIDVEKREFIATTFAFDEKQMDKLKKEIRRFAKRIEDIADTGDCTDVYRMNIQLFPLTKELGEE